MTRPRITLAQPLLIFGTAASLAVSAGLAPQYEPGDEPSINPEIAREGSGTHRKALDEMERKPFTLDLDALTSWNSEPITAEALVGKPVLLLTWTGLSPASNSALRLAQKAYEAHAKDGLVVIGVHHPKGFARAEPLAKRLRITYPYAHDENNTLRSALKVDQDPDFFVIDRAGHMRFADVDSGSILSAVSIVSAETAEAAQKLPQQLEDASNNIKSSRTTTTLLEEGDGLTKGKPPEVEFEMPDAEAFAAIKWPEHNKDRSSLGAKDVQGKPLPVPIDRSDIKYLTDPPEMRGRVVVLHFWTTWARDSIRTMPLLNALQRRDKRDLVVISLSDESEQALRPYAERTTMTFTHAMGKSIEYNLVVDTVPHSVIMSSDGVVRWQGYTTNPEFQLALGVVLKRDPGVKARTEAEEQFKKQSRTIKAD